MTALDHFSPAARTHEIKAALRKAFPGHKFKISRTRIEWTDAGPSVDEVQRVMLATKLVEAKTAWNGTVYLRGADGESFYFDRYNAAERIAEQEDRERRQREREASEQRAAEAIRTARRAKNEAERAIRETYSSTTPDLGPKQAVHEAFEALRQRAEADVASDADLQRRPSWAPPLILEGELLETCRALGYLAADDKPIARLWGIFADPRKPGRALREHGAHSLLGVQCRGFQLHAGAERGPMSSILFEAQRMGDEAWQFGPAIYTPGYYSPRAHEWEQLIKRREGYRETNSESPTELEKVSAQIAAIEAEDLVNARTHHEREHLRRRVVELAQARVLDFAGAPGEQMQLAGRLCGHCFNCFKLLTDPISLEYGIGPDCRANKTEWVRYLAADWLRKNGKPVNISYVVFWSGMPADFVAAILDEASSKAKQLDLWPADEVAR